MTDCRTTFRTKHLNVLGVMVGIIVLTNMSTNNKIVFAEITIPNGKIIDIKNSLNLMFDSLSVTSDK